MTEQRTVEAIVCPGWTGIDGQKAPCGNRRAPSTLLLPGAATPCPRCRKAKGRYDEVHGALEKRKADDLVRLRELANAHIEDLPPLVREWAEVNEDQLAALCEALDALPQRSPWPPFRVEQYHRGAIYSGELWNVVRVIAGLEPRP